MPTSNPGRARRPSRTAISITLPTPTPAPKPDGHFHHLSPPLLVDAGEGILRQDVLLQVFHQDPRLGVVARDAVGRLSQIVRAEREEFGITGNLIRRQSGARDLDHRAELVVDLSALFLHDPPRLA